MTESEAVNLSVRISGLLPQMTSEQIKAFCTQVLPLDKATVADAITAYVAKPRNPGESAYTVAGWTSALKYAMGRNSPNSTGPSKLIQIIRRDFRQYDGMPDIEAVMAHLGQQWKDRTPAPESTESGVKSYARRQCVQALCDVGCERTEAYKRAAVIFGMPEGGAA